MRTMIFALSMALLGGTASGQDSDSVAESCTITLLDVGCSVLPGLVPNRRLEVHYSSAGACGEAPHTVQYGGLGYSVFPSSNGLDGGTRWIYHLVSEDQPGGPFPLGVYAGNWSGYTEGVFYIPSPSTASRCDAVWR